MGEPATQLPAQSSTDTSADDLAAQIEALLGGGDLEAALAPKPSPKPKAVEKAADATAPAAQVAAKDSAGPGAKTGEGGDSLTQDELGSAIEQMLQSAVARVDQIQAETDAMVEVAAREALAATKAGGEATATDATAEAAAAVGDATSAEAAVDMQVAGGDADGAASVSLEDELTALAEQLTAEFKNQSETLNSKAEVAEKAAAVEPVAVAPVAPEPVVEAVKAEPPKVEAVPAAAAPAPPVVDQVAKQVPTEVEPAAVAAPVAVAAAVQTAETVQAKAAAHAVEVAQPPEVIVEAAPVPKKPRKPIGPLIRGIVGKALSPISAASGAAGRALGKPLSMQKPMIRDSAGWIAVVTIFMAACMWGAVLLRDPKPYVPAIAPITLVEGGDGHGGGGGGHGEAKPAAGGGHGEKKPAAGGGHGEAKKADAGHGAAASPIVKREPLIQRGPPGAKKPAPKPASGGGGH